MLFNGIIESGVVNREGLRYYVTTATAKALRQMNSRRKKNHAHKKLN